MEVSDYEKARRCSVIAAAARRQSLPGSIYKGKRSGISRKKSFSDKVPPRCCGSTRICWWEPDMSDVNDTVDFTQETSLHGLKFICQPQRHLIERIFWLVAFIASVLIAGWLISDIWLNYINSPVVVTFQPFETTIDKIPFPAITICNMNKVLRSSANQYIRAAEGPENNPKTILARKNIYYMEHVCSATKSFSQKFNYSSRRGEISQEMLDKARIRDGDDEQSDVARFLRVASQKCTDMLLLCMWQDEVRNCSELFRPLETDFGKCCTMNMIPQTLISRYLIDDREDPKEIAEWAAWDYEKDGLLMNEESQNRTFPRRQRRAGKSSGLSVLLNPDLEEYFCTSSDSQGFRLVKHLPLDIPHVVDFGMAIRPNSEVFMGIRPEITMADPDIRSFKLEKRNCYFRGEFALAYFNHYTTSNCLDECLANQTYTTCGCVRYYMPRDDSRDLCGTSKFNCAEEVRKSSLRTGIKSACDFCLPTCTELEYFSETTVTPIQKGINLWIDDKNHTAKWAKKNVSIVHIYYSSDSTYAKVRKELYGITDLIANTGGLLGLCLGFSGLSLIELVYFYTLRAWCRTRRRRSIWAIVALKLHRIWMKTKTGQTHQYNNNRENTPTSLDDKIVDSYATNDKKRRLSYAGFQPFDGSHNNCLRNSSLNFDANSSSNYNDVPRSSELHRQSPAFIVVPEDSKPNKWGRFAGFDQSQFNTSNRINE